MPRKKPSEHQPALPLFQTDAVEKTDGDYQPLNRVRHRELLERSGVDLYVDTHVPDNFPLLILPHRWEALRDIAHERNVPLKPLIIPVESAMANIQRELRLVKETGMGRLYLISGVTGSGKTTFLNSLRFFLEGVGVHEIKHIDLDSPQSVETSLSALRREKDKLSVVVLEGKEAPGSIQSDELDVLLTTLNTDFRRESGRRTLFVIPTTSDAVATAISQRAASIGGMTSSDRPFFVFEGPQRSQFVSIANTTVQALNESRTLLDYGVANKIAQDLAQTAESIGAFIANCHSEITKRQELVSSFANAISAKRKRMHLWMIFCSVEKNPRRNHDIIRSLTIGDQQHVQVQRVLVGDSAEARYWDKMPGAFALAAQYLDLRIMYLPVRTINAIVTAYGHSEIVDKLKDLRLADGTQVLQRQAVRARAQESLGNTALGAFLRQEGFSDPDPSRRGAVTDKHQQMFVEIVNHASKDDKAINAMIAETLREWKKDPDAKVVTQLSLNASNSLLTDIAYVTSTDIYCLEMKYRTSELHDSDVIRETVRRVKEYTTELPELKSSLENLYG